MCLTECVEEYHVLFNYKCTLSTVVDMLEAEQLEDQFGLFFSPLPPFRTITWCFNVTCQLVYNHCLQYNACFLCLVRVLNFYHLSYLGLKSTFIFYLGGTFVLGCIGLWAFVRPMRSYQCAPDAHNILCSVVLTTCCKMHVQRVPGWAAFEAVWWRRYCSVVIKDQVWFKMLQGRIHKPLPSCPRAGHLTPGRLGWTVLISVNKLLLFNNCCCLCF